jgi:hypothetical protein
MVEAKLCTSQAPTPTGGRSSSMKENTSSTGTTANALMFQEEKMLKVKPFGYGTNMEELTRDGQFFILTKHQRLQRKD